MLLWEVSLRLFLNTVQAVSMKAELPIAESIEDSKLQHSVFTSVRHFGFLEVPVMCWIITLLCGSLQRQIE